MVVVDYWILPLPKPIQIQLQTLRSRKLPSISMAPFASLIPGPEFRWQRRLPQELLCTLLGIGASDRDLLDSKRNRHNSWRIGSLRFVNIGNDRAMVRAQVVTVLVDDVGM